MDCKQMRELLTAYLDGEVTLQEKAQIEAHLSGCSKCQAELEALSATRTSLRGLMKSTAEEVYPSPQIWEQVQSRLDTKGSWLDGVRRLLPKKTWQLAAVTATVVIIAVVASIWQFGGVGQEPPVSKPAPTPAPTPAPAPAPTPSPAPGPTIYIQADASMNKDSYLLGEEIIIEFSFRNVTSDPFEIDPFPPLIEISHHGELLRPFPPGETSKSLDSDEVATYVLTWDQTDEQEQQVPYGSYSISLGEIRLGDHTMSLHLSGSRQFLILPAEGVIEKTIEMHESITTNGITFILNRVELSATGMELYAFNTPPGYSLPPGQPGPAPSFWMHAEAEYSLDGGPAIQAGPSGIGFLEDGMIHSWTKLDPVSKGTKEMAFVVTRLGDREGPWEFHIPLE